MVLIRGCDERVRRGLSGGEFACTYWPATGQEAIAAAMGTVLPTGRPARDHLPRSSHDQLAKGVPDRPSGGRDPHPRHRGERWQGRGHAHLPSAIGPGAVDRDRRVRDPDRGGCRPGPRQLGEGDRPGDGGQLRRRGHRDRVLPRSGQPRRPLGPTRGLRVPGQPVRRDDPDRRGPAGRARLRPGRGVRDPGGPRRRQRSGRGLPGPRRGGRAGEGRRWAHAARVHHLPALRPLLRRSDALHPTRGARGGPPGRAHVGRLHRAALLADGVLDTDGVAAIEEQARSVVDGAFAEALAAGAPDGAEALVDIYADPRGTPQ